MVALLQQAHATWHLVLTSNRCSSPCDESHIGASYIGQSINSPTASDLIDMPSAPKNRVRPSLPKVQLHVSSFEKTGQRGGCMHERFLEEGTRSQAMKRK